MRSYFRKYLLIEWRELMLNIMFLSIRSLNSKNFSFKWLFSKLMIIFVTINNHPFFLFMGIVRRVDTWCVHFNLRGYIKLTTFWWLSHQERRMKGWKRRETGGRWRLFMGVVRTSVGRTLNVKPVLSFTRFKGLVTARNHAARVHAFLPSGIRWNARFFPFRT